MDVQSLVAIVPFSWLQGLTSCLGKSLPVLRDHFRDHFRYCDVTYSTIIFIYRCHYMLLPSLVAIRRVPWLWGFTSCFRGSSLVFRYLFWFCDTISGSVISLLIPLWPPQTVTSGLCHVLWQNWTIFLSLTAENDPLPALWGHFRFSDITSDTLILSSKCYSVSKPSLEAIGWFLCPSGPIESSQD